MPIIKQKIISRLDCRANPDVLFVYGDNDARIGYGGQAKAMRDEPNSIGVRVKNYPDNEEGSFWSDDNLEENCIKMDEDLIPVREHLRNGGIVVLPLDGIGTGRAKMAERCPITFQVLTYMLDHLDE